MAYRLEAAWPAWIKLPTGVAFANTKGGYVLG